VGVEVLRGGVVLTEAGTGPGDGQSNRSLVNSWRNDGGGELATGAWRSS
jgi:hypothetical protein